MNASNLRFWRRVAARVALSSVVIDISISSSTANAFVFRDASAEAITIGGTSAAASVVTPPSVTASAVIPCVITPPSLTPSAPPQTGSRADRETLQKLKVLNQSLGKPPVDARIDRVWHAIPGLCGYDLDIDRSLQSTRQSGDGRIHLAWREIKPLKPLSSLPAEPVYRGPTAEKSMALMFNVSWGEEYIPQILDVLKSHHVHATFFLDGDFVRKQPALAKRIALEGHAIGSHGTGHPDFRHLSSASLERQIVETNAAILHTIGKPVDLLAPPAGSYDDRTVKFAASHHVYTILWTIDTIDWKKPKASAIVSRVVQQKTAGGLVLMHPTKTTAEALPQILRELEDDGYHLKTVEDIVHERPFAPPPFVLSGHL